MTALCWTRCGYKSSTLVHQVWKLWLSLPQNVNLLDDIPATLPKDWRKFPNISNNIIRACPFCLQIPRISYPIGNLEHLHQYCSSTILQRARTHCNQRIENAILNLCNFASINEDGHAFQDRSRHTILQDMLITAARKAELQSRPIVRESRLVNKQRQQHQAIKTLNEVQLLVLLHRLPPVKLEEYKIFPFMAQIGFIHAIPEDVYNIATATITDVSFMGLFPKLVYQALKHYEKMHPTQADEYKHLMEDLISAFVYRPITIQKVIHILISRKQGDLAQFDEEEEHDQHSTTPNEENEQNANNANDTKTADALKNQSSDPKGKKCFGSKCRILLAKGILRRVNLCTRNRNICTGCTMEASKQRKVKQLEHEFLLLSMDNQALAPLLKHRSKPVGLKKLRQLLSCLPSFTNKTREDIIFVAARYLANTLGLVIKNKCPTCILDHPMPSTEYKQLWRTSTFYCKCEGKNVVQHGIRTFCNACRYLVAQPELAHFTICPSCNIFECWEQIGKPCLSCQFASTTFQNPLASRLEVVYHTWLPAEEIREIDDSDSSADENINYKRKITPIPSATSAIDLQVLRRQRRAAIDASIDTIKAKSTIHENRQVFSDLTALKKSISGIKLLPRHDSQSNLTKTQSYGLKPATTSQLRSPLAPVDINAMHSGGSDTREMSTSKERGGAPKTQEHRWKEGTSNQRKRHDRTLQKKALKKSRVT